MGLGAGGWQEQSAGLHVRHHVPYRNSMLTAMLKDSLGGNCATVMLAAISSDPRQLEESISTCRFAQRVACISNQARPRWLRPRPPAASCRRCCSCAGGARCHVRMLDSCLTATSGWRYHYASTRTNMKHERSRHWYNMRY